MLPGLLNVPRTDQEWDMWMWDHRTSHDHIRQKIQSSYGILLPDYPIEPINPNDLTNFLVNNTQLHDDMNGVLGLVSSNVQDADLKDSRQLEAWIKIHYLEHFAAESKLGA